VSVTPRSRPFTFAALGPVAATALVSLAVSPALAQDRLPRVDLLTVDGDKVDLASYGENGKITVISFWATWCTPCVEAVPHLRSLSKRREDDALLVIGVSVDPDPELVRAFVEEEGVTWPQVVDSEFEVADRFGVRGYPTYVLIDHEGRVVYRVSGWSTEIRQQLRNEVARALRQAKKGRKAARESAR